MPEEEVYLSRCVVDVCKRAFNLYSSSGETKIIKCETTQEFMNVLEFVRNVLDDELVYAESFSTGKTTF